MSYVFENALIIQSDRSVLLEVHSPHADAARDAISPFAELIKSPEHIQTYQISPLSIWNARAAGMPVAEMIVALQAHAKYPMPQAVAQEIESLGSRYGLPSHLWSTYSCNHSESWRTSPSGNCLIAASISGKVFIEKTSLRLTI